MPKYEQKIVKLPSDMKIGDQIGIIGEGTDTHTITNIIYKDGYAHEIKLSSGWREPMCKIYLLRGRPHHEAIKDKTAYPEVAIGECDYCAHKFPDSCGYYTVDGGPKDTSMICRECWEKHHKQPNPQTPPDPETKTYLFQEVTDDEHKMTLIVTAQDFQYAYTHAAQTIHQQVNNQDRVSKIHGITMQPWEEPGETPITQVTFTIKWYLTNEPEQEPWDQKITFKFNEIPQTNRTTIIINAYSNEPEVYHN